ncbi:MAG TPA: sarcosine oxidase subunit gamma family protein [Dongiaceae bacterium]|nr:sarcosine oxidase subunit gamma family protein [Dongiaceae bacterium]
MFDRGRFWSPVPDWQTAVINGPDVDMHPVRPDGQVLMVSGNFGTFLAKQGLARCLGPKDSCGDAPYALRLAPDRLLLVGGKAEVDAVPGWLDGIAVSDVTDGYVMIDVLGASAEMVMRAGAAYDFNAPAGAAVESSAILFAGMKVAVIRRADGWRLHVERPIATALWHWLEKAIR